MKVFTFDDNIGSVEYVKHDGDDLTVVNAARVSFGAHKENIDDKDIKLINYLMSHGHTSPFEHCGITFRFVTPLFIRSQHHRHRTWSYNEISRRYTSIDLQFYEPKAFRSQHKSNRQASTDSLINPDTSSATLRLLPTASYPASAAVADHHKKSLELYNVLIEKGVCREQARGVLPQNLYTQYYGTVDLHNLLKFVSLRIHEGAQWEIQQVAKACLQITEQFFPHSVEAYRKHKGDI
ncbi:MAG: thymidylate synthase (FAD) [Euryarchaeota archaeon]|nr:thymidylate synthase (FAD) [Euryarchaeota archaeon]|tara:strand:- start:33763 stop:34473 length:711 start_codon:yes stop_codon:yes gene_type:complete